MYMPRPTFTNNHFYHIYNRGVEKRKIFMSDADYTRFIHGLFEFNSFNPTFNIRRAISKHVRSRTSNKALVDIVSFCLMPNHFHLLVMQRETGGVSKFMQKLGTGYTNYFNIKNKRSGALLQGKFKAIAVQNDTYLTHLSRYIHLNPLDLTESRWKENGISNLTKAKNSLETYKWSSYGDYAGKPRYAETLTQDFLRGYFPTPREYASFVQSWTDGTLRNVKKLTLE